MNNCEISDDNITDFETTVGEKSIESGVQSQNDNNSATHELNINSENNNKEEANLIFKLYNIFSKINWANDPKILNVFKHLRENDEYMVMMSEAWLLQSIAINYPEETFNLLTTLDDKKLKLKTISKICDSFRFSVEIKEKFKSLRLNS